MSVENDIEISSGAENVNVTTTAMATTETTAAPTTAEVIPATNAEATDTTDSNGTATATATAPAPAAKTTIAITETALNPNTTTLQMFNEESNGNAAAQQQQPPQQQQQQQHVHETQSVSIKGKMDSDASLTNFKVLYVVTQLCGLTMIVLIGSWVGVHMGGVAGTSNPKLEFNWHPILMTIGFIFLYGNSILIYRGFRTVNKKTLKLTHASIHIGAFICTVIALKTAFDSHNLAATPIPNMYSLHSWLGLSAVIIFCMQYVAGFMAYLVPGLKENYKIAYMPLHIYFGLFGFILAIASALMGLTEKAIFSIENYAQLPSSGVMANMCGMLFVIFGGLVVYLATEPTYKRQPRPEDAALLTRSSE